MDKPLKHPILVLLLLFLAGAVAGNVLLLAIGSALGGWTALHFAAWLRLGQVATVTLSFILPALYVMRRQGYAVSLLPSRSHRWQDFTYATVAWLSITPLVNLTSQWNHRLTAFGAFKHLEALQQTLAKTTKALINFDTAWEFIIVLLVAAVLAAVAEELFFRGAMQNSLLQNIKPVWAIVIVAVVFSLMHGDALDFVPRVVLGLLLGYVAWKTRTRAVTVLIHTLNNTCALLGEHYGIDALESYGTGSTWYLSVAGLAIAVWALCTIKGNPADASASGQ